MKTDCREIRERFDERLEERLAEAERARVDDHLAGCTDCREELAALESLLVETRRLPREIEPARDLWPGVAARLEPRRAGLAERLRSLLSDWSGVLAPQALAAAAAALLVVVLGALLWRPREADPPQATPAAAQAGPTIALQAELARSEDGVLLARQDLLEAVEAPKEHLSPETVAVIEENMRIIDQAIGEIRSALGDDPLNHQLNMLLAAQYQQEAELLKRVSGV